MFSTDRLRGQIEGNGGFAFANKYLVMLTDLPSGLSATEAKLLQYTCENTSLPTRSIQASEKLIYGTSYQMPYKHAYGEISMTFYLTEDMQSKSFFDRWLDKIVDPNTGDIGYYEDYTCNITVGMYARSDDSPFGNTPKYEVQLESAWPSIVAEVAMSHAAGGEIAKLPITFQYKKWKVTSASP
jgi:hypothetical protein